MIVVLKRYRWTLHLVTIALSCYLVAQAFSTYLSVLLETIPSAEPERIVRPAGESTEETVMPLEDYAVIAERNIFNSAATGIAEAVEGGGLEQDIAGGMLGPAVPTVLKIAVLGTMVVGEGDDRRSSATVKGEKGGREAVYFVGGPESFAEGVNLTRVMKDRIEFVNGRRLEFAKIEDSIGEKTLFGSPEAVHGERSLASSRGEEKPASPGGEGISAEGDRIIVDQSAIDDALANLDRFYTEVRIVPHFQGGRVSGMKVLSVKPDSIISKLGILRGDVLEKVNGQELDVKRGMTLFNDLKNEKKFSIDLKRGGQNKTLVYEIR